jgi:hypothetical protein
MLTRVLNGAAGPDTMERLEALCHMVRDTSLCGLGQTAPNPTLSTLRYFRTEYEAKLRPGSAAQRLNLPVITPLPNPIAGPGRNPAVGEPAT